ncbi:hypothetical protein M407DRAFT_18177 [Tulasnella calospora MUT 4182]|uniref:Protein kinase domain-containing protein n=1 Tax=Tulasnella calospora MUT 4182 TaxID=1051891 RepID=A0A0C3QUG5_9AGAM|nr:hypothetical protein M407DRAFT_18177 [Tulasnella calospora MUT 4182]
MSEKEQGKSATSPQGAVEGEDAGKRLRICPGKVLESLSHLRIDRAEIKPIELEGQPPKAGGKANVETAILASTESSRLLDSYEEETWRSRSCILMRAFPMPLAHEVNLLNDLSHENVVKILGFVEDVGQGVAWMVFAWEQNGNLREFIRSAQWELPERVSLIHDVAKGLSCLHGRDPAICPGDLKSLNILVNPENRAVITDFGSARAVDLMVEGGSKGVRGAKVTPPPHSNATGPQDMEALIVEIGPSEEFITMMGPAWTVRWAAPELLDGDLPGLTSDIWAFGWICWDAVTGNFPFDKENDVAVVLRITKGDLPNVQSDHQFHQIKALCSLMRECWTLDTSERATNSCEMPTNHLMDGSDQIVPSRREAGSLSVTRSSGLLYALGWIQMWNNMFKNAQGYFEQSFKVDESVGDEGGKAMVMKAIGDVHRMRNEYSKAEELYIEARHSYFQIWNQLGFAQSVMSLGDVYRMRNEYSKAEESYIEARDIYSQSGNRLGFAQSVERLGDVCRRRDQYSQAEESYLQARGVHSQIGNRLGFAQSAQSLGDVYRMRDEYSKAEELHIEARDVFVQIGNRPGFAQSVKSLGDVHYVRGEYSKAEESYIQARDIYIQIGDRLGFAQSVKSLGAVYYMRDEHSKAEESYIQARDIYSQIEDRLGLAQSVERLGDLYRMRAQYSKAEEAYIEARGIHFQIENRLGFPQSVQSLGDLYRMRDEYYKAEESYIQARDVYSQIGDRLGSAQSVKSLGAVCYMRDEYSKAEGS